MVYRSTWISLVALAGLAGLAASVRTLSVPGVLALFFAIGVGAASVSLVATTEDGPMPWVRAGRTGGAVGLAAVAAAGLVVWLGVTGLVVVVSLVVLSPTVLALVPRRVPGRRRAEGQRQQQGPDQARTRNQEPPRSRDAGPRRTPPVAPPTASPVPAALLRLPWMQEPVGSMDDATLCLAWRTSYVALQRPLAGSVKLEIVQRRQHILDELERRSPRGFSAWITSGARAAGDPSRYLSHPW